MSIKLLESINTDDNPVAQNPDDGAAMNFLSSYKKSGRVWGAAITWSGKVFSIAKGLLIARGYRISIDSATTLIDLTKDAMPSAQSTYNVLLKITRVGHNASFSIAYQSASSSYETDLIDQGEGTYCLKLGSLVLNSNGVVSFTDSMTIIAPPSGGSGTSVGGMLPAPILEIVSKRVGGSYSGYLSLKNKGDYNGYASSYTIKLCLFRYVSHAKYREKSGTTKVYIQKSSWVSPASSIGWGSALVSNIVLFSALKTVTVDTNGTLSYVRKDVIAPLSDYCNAMFYDKSSGTKAAVSSATDVYAIRATRSKKTKTQTQYGHHHKHNYFIFAYKIVLYSGLSIVATSPISNAIVITPNLSKKITSGTTGGINDKFKIKVC